MKLLQKLLESDTDNNTCPLCGNDVTIGHGEFDVPTDKVEINGKLQLVHVKCLSPDQQAHYWKHGPSKSVHNQPEEDAEQKTKSLVSIVRNEGPSAFGSDTVGRTKDGHYIFRRGFFYGAFGNGSEKHAENVSRGLKRYGIPHEIIDHGEIWKPFKGNAKTANSSHWWTKVELIPNKEENAEQTKKKPHQKAIEHQIAYLNLKKKGHDPERSSVLKAHKAAFDAYKNITQTFTQHILGKPHAYNAFKKAQTDAERLSKNAWDLDESE